MNKPRDVNLSGRGFDTRLSPSALLLVLSVLLPACTQISLSDPLPEQPGFRVWRAAELEQRNNQLAQALRPDGSGRETLADYVTPTGSHRFRFIRRDRDGLPEQHDHIEDYVYIQSGRGTILVGGQMLGRQGDIGTRITGGTRYAVGQGDVLRIPAGVPHAYLVGEESHITYVLARMPAYTGRVTATPDGEAPALQPEGFGLWRAAELERRNLALSTRVRANGSSRETLADYGAGGGSHRIRFLRREADGPPELHEDIIDVVFVQSGAGIVHVGGEMIGSSNVIGSRIVGGESHPVAAGDVIHVPVGMPHGYRVSDDSHITYVLVRMPAFIP